MRDFKPETVLLSNIANTSTDRPVKQGTFNLILWMIVKLNWIIKYPTNNWQIELDY